MIRYAVMVAAILLAGMLAANAAPARHHHHHHPATGFARGLGVGLAHMIRVDHRRHRRAPWCGIWMQQHTGIHGPGNLAMAREWARIGQPAGGPAPGVIGVMPHHVFQVVAMLAPGKVLAISGNDGGAVRTRPRSTAGVIAWRRV